MSDEVAKGPGHDWIVFYEYEDGQRFDMDVFGVMTVEEAALEARRSLTAIELIPGAVAPGFAILAVVRRGSGIGGR